MFAAVTLLRAHIQHIAESSLATLQNKSIKKTVIVQKWHAQKQHQSLRY